MCKWPASAEKVSSVTDTQTVHAGHFIIMIYKATCFGCTRQPLSASRFRNIHKKVIQTALAINTAMKREA